MITRVEEILEAQVNKPTIPNTRENEEQTKINTKATSAKSPVKNKTKPQTKHQPSQNKKKKSTKGKTPKHAIISLIHWNWQLIVETTRLSKLKLMICSKKHIFYVSKKKKAPQ